MCIICIYTYMYVYMYVCVCVCMCTCVCPKPSTLNPTYNPKPRLLNSILAIAFFAGSCGCKSNSFFQAGL